MKICLPIGNQDHFSMNCFLTNLCRQPSRSSIGRISLAIYISPLVRRGNIMDHGKPVRDQHVKAFVLIFDVAEHRCTICPKYGTADWNL